MTLSSCFESRYLHLIEDNDGLTHTKKGEEGRSINVGGGVGPIQENYRKIIGYEKCSVNLMVW